MKALCQIVLKAFDMSMQQYLQRCLKEDDDDDSVMKARCLVADV